MEAQSRRQVSSVRDQLFDQPYTFEFDQVVKLVESMHQTATPIGEGFSIDDEILTIKSRVFLSAPPSDVYDINRTDYKTTLTVNFFGLAGLQGPLPMPFTETILSRLKAKDTAASDFLDIFNHRLISILHRIRKKHWVGLDHRLPHQTFIGRDLLALNGMSSDTFKSRAVSPEDLLYYSGLFWQQPKSPVGLKQIIGHYFNTKVTLQSHIGGWIDISPDRWTYLNKNNVLGQTAMIGTKIWDVNQNLRIRLGPMDFKRFAKFLKNGDSYPKLLELMKSYLPSGYKFSINLSLLASDVQQTRLDGKTNLGWTSWIDAKPAKKDDEQVILYPEFKDDDVF